MKKMIGLIILLISFSVQAWISVDDPGKVYSFKFRMKSEIYEYSQKASSYEEAFDKAAQSCFSHFKQGRRVSQDQGLDIIDVCANPRST